MPRSITTSAQGVRPQLLLMSRKTLSRHRRNQEGFRRPRLRWGLLKVTVPNSEGRMKAQSFLGTLHGQDMQCRGGFCAPWCPKYQCSFSSSEHEHLKMCSLVQTVYFMIIYVRWCWVQIKNGSSGLCAECLAAETFSQLRCHQFAVFTAMWINLGAIEVRAKMDLHNCFGGLRFTLCQSSKF